MTRQEGNQAKSKKTMKSERSRTPSRESRPKCPQCGSLKVWKSGLRDLKGGGVMQRWVCRECCYRFSDSNYRKGSQNMKSSLEKPLQNPSKRSLYNCNTIVDHSQVLRVLARGSKNLVKTESQIDKRAAGATETRREAEVKGRLIEFAWWMKKQGYAESTIIGRTQLLHVLIDRGANVLDPESIKATIAKQNWSEGRKNNAVVAYTTFLHMKGGKWNPPRYRQERKLPFIPAETEIDQLVSGCSQKISCFLQTLKETAMRPGEA